MAGVYSRTRFARNRLQFRKLQSIGTAAKQAFLLRAECSRLDHRRVSMSRPVDSASDAASSVGGASDAGSEAGRSEAGSQGGDQGADLLKESKFSLKVAEKLLSTTRLRTADVRACLTGQASPVAQQPI